MQSGVSIRRGRIYQRSVYQALVLLGYGQGEFPPVSAAVIMVLLLWFRGVLIQRQTHRQFITGDRKRRTMHGFKDPLLRRGQGWVKRCTVHGTKAQGHRGARERKRRGEKEKGQIQLCSCAIMPERSGDPDRIEDPDRIVRSVRVIMSEPRFAGWRP